MGWGGEAGVGSVPCWVNWLTVVPVRRIQLTWLVLLLPSQMRSSIGSSDVALALALLLPAASRPVTGRQLPRRSPR